MLDDATYGNDAAATSGTVIFTSPTLTWTGNLSAGGSVTVTYSVTVKSPDTGDMAFRRVLVEGPTSAVFGSMCLNAVRSPCRTGRPAEQDRCTRQHAEHSIRRFADTRAGLNFDLRTSQ